MKSGHGQRTHKVLEDQYLNILENNSTEKGIIKHKGQWALSLQRFRDLAGDPHGSLLVELDVGLRKLHYIGVLFYLGLYPKMKETVIIALGSSGFFYLPLVARVSSLASHVSPDRHTDCPSTVTIKRHYISRNIKRIICTVSVGFQST